MAGDSPAVIIYGPTGNPVTGYNPASTIADTDDAAIKRLQVQAELKPGTSVLVGAPIPTNVGDILAGFLTNGTYGRDLIQDGSVTPIVYEISSDPTRNIKLSELRLVMTASAIDMNGGSFGHDVALLNGILIQLVLNEGTTTLGNLTLNEEILIMPSRSGVLFDASGGNDILVASYDLGGAVILHAQTIHTDTVRLTVRDDLTKSSLNFLVMAVSGVYEDVV